MNDLAAWLDRHNVNAVAVLATIAVVVVLSSSAIC
jgi:hypothetical protein